jgi:hypothetical protein
MPKLLRTRKNQQQTQQGLALSSYYPTTPSVASTHRKVSEEDIQSSHSSGSSSSSSSDISTSTVANNLSDNYDAFATPQQFQNSFSTLKRRAQSVCLVDLVPPDQNAIEMSIRSKRVVSPVTTAIQQQQHCAVPDIGAPLSNSGRSSPSKWGHFTSDETFSDSDSQGTESRPAAFDDEEWDWKASAHTTSFLPMYRWNASTRTSSCNLSPRGHYYHPYPKPEKRRRILSPQRPMQTLFAHDNDGIIHQENQLDGFILKYPSSICIDETTERILAMGL